MSGQVVLSGETRRTVRLLRDASNLLLRGDDAPMIHRQDSVIFLRLLAEDIEQQTRPPKVKEPQGLGAVVATDEDGDFIRVSLEVQNPWLNVQDGRQCHWDGVPAVKVLSEGVQP